MNQLINEYRQTASANIENAISLPFAVYHDQEIFELEAESIFRNEWIFICSEHELKEPGDYYAFDLVGESIAIIRGEDNVLRALSNNCRHRGTPILDLGFGKVNKIMSCPYHAWSYDTQGNLKGVPFPGNINIEKEQHCLPAFHLELFLGLVFINLSDNPSPLQERFSGIEKYTQIFEPERFTMATLSKFETWQANWKLAMENAMESYHLFKVHQQTLEVITPTKQACYVAGSSEWSLTAGSMTEYDQGLKNKIANWFYGAYPKAYDHYLLICLPPSFVGIMTYESFGWIHIMPIDHRTSLIRAASISDKAETLDQSTEAFTQAFFAEDKAICERVQQGMYSRKGKGGKLVEMERVVVDFHQFLATRMFTVEKSTTFVDTNASIFTAIE